MEALESTPPTMHAAADIAPLTYGLDYYKPTMSQFSFEHEPDAEVTFTFKNRGKQRLMDFVRPEELQERFDAIREQGWVEPEVQQLGAITINGDQKAFSPRYLDYLRGGVLPEVEVSHDHHIDDIAIRTTGEWPLVTFWETQIMGDTSQTYFRNYLRDQGVSEAAVWNEGDRRLTDFISTMQQNPDIKFMEFGTRRRFSLDWQRHVTERLATECPENLLGTSNVGLARELGLRLLGTIAHEEFMVNAGLADARGGDIRGSHNKVLQDWHDYYGYDYSIFLTDTFTTDFFFNDLTREQAANGKGLRHDSGDPFQFGERAIGMYEGYGIDPRDKSCVFSDSLDTQKVLDLHDRFAGRINDTYGIGTFLSNNLGLKALNMVMKATHVRDSATGQEGDTVKLSDDAGKHTGPAHKVRQYQQEFAT